MAIVNGDGVLIKFNNGDSFVPFACARSITLNMITDIVGISTVGSGNWKEKEAVALDWNFTIEGIVYLDMDDSLVAPSVYELWVNMSAVQIQFFVIDVDGNEFLMTGSALITNVSTNGAVNNVSSINITGEGTGELLLTSMLKVLSVLVHADPVNEIDITFGYGNYPGATVYTIEVNDLTDVTTTTDAGGASPRTISGLPSTHHYSFRLKNNITNQYGPYLYYSL